MQIMEQECTGVTAHSHVALPLVVGSSSFGIPSLTLGLVATLHPPVRNTGLRYTGRYFMSFRGETVVEGSRDPECDLARALLTRGIVGKVTIVDADTGKPRTIIDIEKLARLSAEEGPNGPRLRRWRESRGTLPLTGANEAGAAEVTEQARAASKGKAA